jgi:hypothetical protein
MRQSLSGFSHHQAMQRFIVSGVLGAACLWSTRGEAQARLLKFDRPRHAEYFEAVEPAGIATLRSVEEWSAFVRRHWRIPEDVPRASPPLLDFRRFMAVALWHPGYSGCRDFRDWVDSVRGEPDTIRVFGSIPPSGPCQALVNSFDIICLTRDPRPVAVTEDRSRRREEVLLARPPKPRSGSRGWCG